MALPNMSQWRDPWNGITQTDGLGELYTEAAPIFNAFVSSGLRLINPGNAVREKHTTGATVSVVATDAGASHTAAPAQTTAFTKDMAGIVGQATVEVAFADEEAELAASLGSAIYAIYRGFVSGILGSGNGTDYAMWSIGSFVTTYTGQADNTGDTYVNLLKALITAKAQLATGGTNICVTSTEAFSALKNRIIADLGGVGLVETRQIDVQLYGAEVFYFDNCYYFATDVISPSPSNTAAFNFFNIGPQGCRLWMNNTGQFRIQNPVGSRTDISETRNVILAAQLGYQSPRAAYKLTTLIA